MAIPWEVFNRRNKKMEKYIYKITNKINGKSYIGQAKNPQIRWGQHQRNGLYAIGKAIRKYGADSFNYEILEKSSNYNEREIYYISYYDTYKNGYNLTLGGEDGSREEYDIKQILPVIEALKRGERLDILQEQYGHSVGFLVDLNYGRIYQQEEVNYPLSPNANPMLDSDEVRFIEDFLIDNQSVSLKQIGIQVGRGKTTIESINNGKHKYSRKLDFPLKKKGSQLTENEFFKIVDFLSNTNFSQKEIAKMVDREKEIILKINNGSHRLCHLLFPYPIR